MSVNKPGYNRIYARINMDNLRENILKMKSMTKPDIKVLAVVKADAYGHGAVGVSQRIRDLADYFGVATIDEAVELRLAGITEDFPKLIKYNITQAVYDVAECEKLSRVALDSKTKVKVHIKIDTGMGRIGFSADEAGVNEALRLKDMPGLDIEGIFTHYAKADEYDKTYSIKQKESFLWFIQRMEAAGVTFALKHIDNSAGTMEMDDQEFDMVRLGIVTYGLYPSDEVDKSVEIKPVMSLISHVSHVKTVEPGKAISYGGTYVTEDVRKIATVTVGYADGYPRAQSNLGRVIVRGEYAPIIGRVCMDQMMIDVTDIPGVSVKDEVILIGGTNDKYISVEEVVRHANSFNYELVCHIGRRVPHVYHEDGTDTVCVNYLV